MNEPPRLPTECVELTVRMPSGRTKTIWAKPVKGKVATPGRRSFVKVDNQGEVPVTYNASTNVETKHVNVWVVGETDIVSEKPAVYSCKYAELEVA